MYSPEADKQPSDPADLFQVWDSSDAAPSDH